MAKKSWVKNSELGFINNLDSCELVCSTEKLDSTKINHKVQNNVEIEKPKLISADEIAASYISNQKNSTILTESDLVKPTHLMGEFGHFAISHVNKKKMAERFDKAIIQESKEPHNIDTLLSIVEDVELDRAKLKKHLLKVGE